MLTICVTIAALILSKAGMIWEGVAAAMLLTMILDAALFAFLIACHYGVVNRW